MNPQNSKNNESNESNSMALNLESSNTEYKNLLIEYKQAVSNYVNFLKDEYTSEPCYKYNADSKGISQECYNEIWKKAGCGAGTIKPAPDANSDWAKGMTLNGLIQDSWSWATLTDYTHRMGCYGQYDSPYIILCVGTDGNLYSRQGLDAAWQKIQDDSNGNIRTICTGNDGKTIICTNSSNDILTKPSWDAPNWQGPVQNPCCVMSVAQGQDGSIVGVGMNNVLWSKPDLNGNWTQTATPGEWITAICIGPDGSIFCIGGGNQIWKKNSYQNLPSQQWEGMGSCCVKSITIAPDGTFIGAGTDNQLYTKTSYKDLTTSWQGPYNSQNSSCCAVSITTVANSNYDSSKYNSSTQPEYKLNTVPMTNVKSTAFWGASPLSQSTVSTVGECQALCSKTDGCSGATYNETTSLCSLRKGDGDIMSGSPTDYSIVPKAQSLLKIVKNINDKLTKLNEKIQKLSKTSETKFDSQSQQLSSSNTDLINQYTNLVGEREKIQKMLNEYQTLDEQHIQGNIHISQNYYSFILLMILVVLVIFLLYKFSIPSAQSTTKIVQNGGQLGTSAYYIVFGIFLLILLLTCYNKYKLL